MPRIICPPFPSVKRRVCYYAFWPAARVRAASGASFVRVESAKDVFFQHTLDPLTHRAAERTTVGTIITR
ncbi:MAG: hypothetical protein ACYC6N_22050, partial [Pirellulaceae bacterium]